MLDKQTVSMIVGVLVMSLLPSSSLGEDVMAKLKERSEKTVGNVEEGAWNCIKCHEQEVGVWKQSRHFTAIENLPNDFLDKAADILEKMGSEKVKIHNLEGGKEGGKEFQTDKGTGETAEQKAARLMAAEKAGMLHSQMIYDIAANCYGCHTVPQENIVNKGGHPAGSAFELISWSQGEIRHNFLSAPDRKTNAKTPPEKLRLLYVIGHLVDYEMTLRNVLSVKEKGGKFHAAMLERANQARAALEAILGKAELPMLKEALSKAPSPLTADSALDEATVKGLETAARAFLKEHDGSKLAALDALLPAENTYRFHKEK
jgi:hypothetical protein